VSNAESRSKVFSLPPALRIQETLSSNRDLEGGYT